MNGNVNGNSGENIVDPILAELAEQITRQLQAGEVVDLEYYCDRHPRLAGPIRRLLPTLQRLAVLEDRATE